MSEDEAFIRAIVDSPGDDLPRLVYADWLDDRADPRGPYLRAELEWAKPWQAGEAPEQNEELHRLAANLDPVWVARISRPPAGICLSHINIAHPKVKPTAPNHITRDDLAAFEKELDVELPKDYVAFILNWNGCTLERCNVHTYRQVRDEVDDTTDEEDGDDDVVDDEDGDVAEDENEPSYIVVPAGRARITIMFYPIDFSYRMLPESEWEGAARIAIEESDEPEFMIQADYHKYMEIGKSTGAVPGVYQLVLESYEDVSYDIGKVLHNPSRVSRRGQDTGNSLPDFLASLTPLS